jgi:hypothetical protein
MFDEDPGEQARVSASDFAQMRDEMSALRKQRDEAITFIKSLNAIKGEHARVYRARCGRFLAGLKEGAE